MPPKPKTKKEPQEQAQYDKLATEFFRRIQVPKKDTAPLVLSPADKKKFGDPKFADYLVGLLHNGTRKEQENAAYALGIMGANKMLKGVSRARAVIALTRSLNTFDEISTAAAFALGKIGDKSAIPFLLRSLPADPRHVGAQIPKYRNLIIALGELRAREAVPKLLAFVRTVEVPDAMQSDAASALGMIRDPRAVKPLLDIVISGRIGRSSELPVQLHADIVKALGRIGGSKIQKLLIKRLYIISNPAQSMMGGDPTEEHKKECETLTFAYLSALSNFRTREAKTAIAMVLYSEQEKGPRLFAITTLEQMGKLPPDAVSFLRAATDAYPVEVAREAENLLLKIRRTMPVKK